MLCILRALIIRLLARWAVLSASYRHPDRLLPVWFASVVDRGLERVNWHVLKVIKAEADRGGYQVFTPSWGGEAIDIRSKVRVAREHYPRMVYREKVVC